MVVRALVRCGCLAAGLAHAALLATFESQEHMHLVATTRSSNAYRRTGSGNRHQGGNHPLLRARGHPSSCRPKDRKSTPSELQSLMRISYAAFCLKKKTQQNKKPQK